MTQSTSAQLKDKIDSGATGDKVAFPDPAMAPLGTDEEAGGNPTHPESIHQAIRYEAVHRRPQESMMGFIVVVLATLLIGAVVIVSAYLI